MIRIGLMSDTHINSEFCDLSALEQSIEELNKKSDVILHSGDITDGIDVYRGQRNDQVTQKVDDVIELTKELFGMFHKDVYIIGGNHDESYHKKLGLSIGSQLMDNKHIHYLGMHEAEVELNGLTFRLLHPTGGGSYSISYPLQKYVRQVNLHNEDFQWIIAGHLHHGYYFNIQGVNVVGLPSYLKPNPYSRRRGYGEEIGYDILKFYKTRDFTLEMRRFK